MNLNDSRIKTRTITNILTTLILATFVIVLVLEWKNIPEVVPTHYDIHGQANAYGGKSSLIIIPVIGILICLIISIVERFPQHWNYPVEVTEENRERLINDGLIMLGILKVLIAMIFSYIGISTIKGMVLSTPMYLLISLLFIDIILGFIKMVKDK